MSCLLLIQGVQTREAPPKEGLTQATLTHSLYEAIYGRLIIIVTVTKHGPVDATDDILNPSSSLASIEVNVLQNDRKYVFLITAGRVQFIGAEFGVEILGCDDCYQSSALL